ncbi:MAG: glycosyltransferase family 61 protein [Rubellimicrobium sp.]|nr:glycosyltransferase family 61 protein [Rubellimicrobium sp.]
MAISRYRIFEQTPAPPPAALLWRDEMPTAILAEHDRDQPVPAVALVRITGHHYGGQGLVSKKGRITFKPGVFPDHLAGMARDLGTDAPVFRAWAGALERPGVRTIRAETPVLVPVHANWIYGHALTEILLRALLLDQSSPPDWPLALADPGPHWLPDLLRMALPHRPFLRFDPACERLAAPALIGCTEVFSPSGIAPGVLPLLALLKARLLARAPAAPTPRRLFLSRGDNHRRRATENRAEIEAIARDLGFAVIRPEDQPFAEQVRLAAGAQVIAGEFGSAMHNSLFAGPGTTVICLNWINAYQSIIARSLGHRAGYVRPDDGIFRDSAAIWEGRRRMRFDPHELRRKLAEVAAADPDETAAAVACRGFAH